MERGKVRIAKGIAEIDTDKAPRPVAFRLLESHRFRTGDDVMFLRSYSNPGWATRVVPAAATDNLVRLAGPTGGFTRGAATLVLDKAARFIAQTQMAPTPEQVDEHLTYARKAMEQVAKMGEAKSGRLNVQQVRSMLK